MSREFPWVSVDRLKRFLSRFVIPFARKENWSRKALARFTPSKRSVEDVAMFPGFAERSDQSPG